MADLTKLSNADLEALATGNLNKMSDAGLMVLQGSAPRQDKSTAAFNVPAGLVQGAADIGATILQPVDWAARKMGVSNDIVGYEPGERRRLITEGLKSAAQAMGGEVNPESLGFQGGRLVTNIAGTAGAPGAVARPFIAAERVAPVAGTVGRAIESAGFTAPNVAGRVAGGGAAGGASAAMVNPEDIGYGAMGGGLFGAVGKPLVEGAVNVGRKLIPASMRGQQGADFAQVQGVANALGIDVKQLSPKMNAYITSEVEKATRAGKNLDLEALARSAEFEELGMKPLLGQITRDPTQFAQERNLRGAGTGIQERLTEQNRALQNIFGQGAEGAQEPYQAGKTFIDVLRRQDESAKSQIDALYKAAREKNGRYADIDHVTFIENANKKLDEEMLGRFLPEQSRALLNDIAQGKVPLNVNNLVQVDSVLSAAQRSADAAGAKAIGVIRNALHDAPISSAAGAEAKAAFDTARSAARARFSTIESNPALKAILDGKAVPDDFVSKFVIRGKADNVKTLADTLRSANPEAFSQAKSQMAADIQRAAFGENITADAAIRPEILARKLREIGTEKMSAFFSPEEIARYNTAVKVANYIEKHPNAAPVNTSNTLVAALMQSPLISAAERIPVIGGAIGLGKAAAGTIQKQATTSRAMNANIPAEKMGLTDAQRRLMVKILGPSGAAAGVVSQ